MTAPALPAPPSGRFDGRVHRFPVRVYFEDTDLSGVVYHANYLRYMERARSDMLRLAGIDQRAANDAGEGAWAITDLSLAYRAAARLDDALIVTTRLVELRRASVVMAQQVSRDGLILTDGAVTAAFVSPEGRARRLLPGWSERFALLLDPLDIQGPA